MCDHSEPSQVPPVTDVTRKLVSGGKSLSSDISTNVWRMRITPQKSCVNICTRHNDTGELSKGQAHNVCHVIVVIAAHIWFWLCILS